MKPEDYTKIIWDAYPIHDLKLNALGLCGEAGEFANKVKQQTYKEILNADLIEELSDILWHVTQCSHILGSDLQSLMEISAAKTIAKNKKES